MLNLGVLTESRTEPFIWSTDCSHFVNHDPVQVLRYRQ